MPRSRPVALVTGASSGIGKVAAGAYAASQRARQLSALRRITPARTFDKQLRKFNKLAG